MLLKSKDHYDLLEFFEKQNNLTPEQREDKELWVKGCVYKNGEINKLFISFREGVAYGISIV